MKKYVMIVLAAICAMLMLVFPAQTLAAARRGCQLWATSVMPGLFPFMVCMLILTTRFDFSNKGRKVVPFLGIPKNGAYMMVLGLLSGAPGAARIAREGWDRGVFTPKTLLRYAVYTGTMSPMFVMGTLAGWLGLGHLGIILLICHWLAAFITGQLSRLLPLSDEAVSASNTSTDSGPMSLGAAVQSSALAMLSICGCMMLGCVAADLIGCVFPSMPSWANPLIQSLMEVTSGCQAMISLGWGAPVVLWATTMGGGSMLMQAMAFYPKGVLPIGWLIAARLVSGFIAFGLCQLITQLLQPTVQTMAPVLSQPSFTVITLWFICLITYVCRPVTRPISEHPYTKAP